MSQVEQMLDRKRDYDRTKMAYLTVLDETVEGVEVRYEVCNPLLRRPRITVTCRPGTTLAAIAESLSDVGWDDVYYRQWLVNNGQGLVAKGRLT
jgi:hypothetical protein